MSQGMQGWGPNGLPGPKFTMNFASGVNAVIPSGTYVAADPLDGGDTFSRLAKRLVDARTAALAEGLPMDAAELVISEAEWVELNDAMRLVAVARPPAPIELWGVPVCPSEPIELWGVPVRVEWKPGTQAAMRRIESEEAVSELLRVIAELGEG